MVVNRVQFEKLLAYTAAAYVTIKDLIGKSFHGNCKALFIADFSFHCCTLIVAFVSLWSTIIKCWPRTKMYLHDGTELKLIIFLEMSLL